MNDDEMRTYKHTLILYVHTTETSLQQGPAIHLPSTPPPPTEREERRDYIMPHDTETGVEKSQHTMGVAEKGGRIKGRD